MAGLLDLFGSTDDAQRAGLLMLAAAGPRAQPASFGQRLLESVQQFDAGTQQKKDRAAQEEERRIRQQLIQAQIGETQAQAAQRQAQAAEMQRKAEEAQRIQALVRDTVGQSVKPIQANQASGIAGPRPEALSVVGSRPPVDWQSLIAQGVPAELVKQLAEAPTLGRAKVARTAEVMGPNGPETVQLDEFGNRVGSGMAKPFELRMQDLGGKVAPINPYTGAMAGVGLGKTNTPDALLGAQTTMRGQNMTDARAREKNAIDLSAVGKVDWKQDVNGAWVGLPKEVNGAGPVTPVTTTTPGKREQQANNALAIIDQAEKLIDKGTGSYLGAGVDQVARAMGAAPAGAVAGGQLKALEGALMMAQPRMEGPQSNMDVQLYRQMAAQIGDPTVPPKIKKAALDTVKGLHQKYATQNGMPEASTQPAAGVRRYNPQTERIE